jgi:iron-sulfur cluster insertion protein
VGQFTHCPTHLNIDPTTFSGYFERLGRVPFCHHRSAYDMTDTLNGTATTQTAFVTASATATAKIRELMDQEGLGEGQGLRVRVVGGGCHGFSYSLNFDSASAQDFVMPIGGVTFLVDKFSAPYLMGAEIDYVDTLQGAGFKITNPHAKCTCGCGSSFSA